MREWCRGVYQKRSFYLILLCVLYIGTFLINIPDQDTMNVRNSDAVWHTLLITECMEEVPVSVHKMLPIVTLGDEADKHIPWGACVPDQYGNYYYTSFMPLSFIVPYLFFELPGIKATPFSLSLLSAILGLISCVLLYQLLVLMYGKRLNRGILLAAVLALYMFAPEMLHSNTEVYWGQNLYQPILILQLIVLCHYLEQKGKARRKYLAWLALLSFVGGCIEWTAYVMNMGLAFCMIIKNSRNRKKALKGEKWGKFDFIWIGVVSVAAGSTVIAHFLSVLGVEEFKRIMLKQFMLRNISNRAGVLAWNAWQEYFDSFGIAISAVVVVGVAVLSSKETRGKIKKAIKSNQAIVVFAAGIACLENVLMAQHALEYTYDRIKLGILLTLLFLFLLVLIWENKTEIFQKMLILFFATAALINLISFRFVENGYRWIVDGNYRDNETLAEALGEKYTKENSLYGQIPVTAVRGYTTLLFQRNIYDLKQLDDLEELAEEGNKRYVVYLLARWDIWQKSLYQGAVISDLYTGRQEYWNMSDGGISCSELNKDQIYALPYTDEIAELGVFKETSILRMDMTEENRELLENASAIRDKMGENFPIAYLTYQDNYIDVQLNLENELKEKMDYLKFPNEIQIIKEEQE